MPSGPKSSRSRRSEPSSSSPSPSPSPSRRLDVAAGPSISFVSPAPGSCGDQHRPGCGHVDPSTPRLSLNHLKQGESHQRIRHGAKQLLLLTDNFPGYNGPGPEGGYETANDQALPDDSDIRAMTRLSHSIARDISEIMALRKDDPVSPPHKRKGGSDGEYDDCGGGGGGVGPPADHPGHHDYTYYCHTGAAAAGGRNPRNRRKVEFACHRCRRVDTPEWRTGPDGPSTLCNVCGLIYAKRERKREESTMPSFGSPNFS